MSATPLISNALAAGSPHLPVDNVQLAALRSGDVHAFEQVVGQLQRPLYTFAWRYLQNHADAEDVVVEAFLRLHRSRERLRPDTNVASWLFATLSNLCHNRHRWRRRHPEVTLQQPEIPAVAVPESLEPDVALERDEAARALRVAIDQLPHDQRTVVLLYHYEHLSYREIGAVVGCSERGVETRLYRAKQRLRVELERFLST